MMLPTVNWVFLHQSTIKAIPHKTTGQSDVENSLLILSSQVIQVVSDKPANTGAWPSEAEFCQFLDMHPTAHLFIMSPPPQPRQSLLLLHYM